MARLLVLAPALGYALVAPARPLRSSVKVQESFGFDFAESQESNTESTILGERCLKEEFIRSYKPTATVTFPSQLFGFFFTYFLKLISLVKVVPRSVKRLVKGACVIKHPRGCATPYGSRRPTSTSRRQ